MDDPMIRSRLGRIKGTRPLGVPDPKREPPFYSQAFEIDARDRLPPTETALTIFTVVHPRRELDN